MGSVKPVGTRNHRACRSSRKVFTRTMWTHDWWLFGAILSTFARVQVPASREHRIRRADALATQGSCPQLSWWRWLASLGLAQTCVMALAYEFDDATGQVLPVPTRPAFTSAIQAG